MATFRKLAQNGETMVITLRVLYIDIYFFLWMLPEGCIFLSIPYLLLGNNFRPSTFGKLKNGRKGVNF